MARTYHLRGNVRGKRYFEHRGLAFLEVPKSTYQGVKSSMFMNFPTCPKCRIGIISSTTTTDEELTCEHLRCGYCLREVVRMLTRGGKRAIAFFDTGTLR